MDIPNTRLQRHKQQSWMPVLPCFISNWPWVEEKHNELLEMRVREEGDPLWEWPGLSDSINLCRPLFRL